MRLVVAAAAAVLFVPAPESADGLAFAPEEGSELAKRFTWTVTRTTNDSSLRLGESEMPPSSGITTRNEAELAVRDTYAKVVDGRPALLRRTYERITSERVGENVPADVELAGLGERHGPLEGHTVEFVRNQEEDEYDVRFVGDDGDDAWLEDAREDLDLRVLLPGKEVGLGDSWELEPAALADVLMPGGDVQWSAASDGADDDSPGVVHVEVPRVDLRDLFGHFHGDVVATFEGEADGLWTVHLDLSLEADAVLTDARNDELLEEGSELRYDEVAVEATLSGEGELVWNAARGTFESFTFEGETTSLVQATWSQVIGPDDVEMSYTGDLEGTLEVEHRAGE